MSRTQAYDPTMGSKITDIDDNIVACRAWGHDWPKLRPGKALPKRFRPALQPGGVVLITETCGNCGKTRETLTLSGGIFDRGAVRHYFDPKNWVVIPAYERVTPRDFQAETYRRLHEEIMAAAKQSEVGEP
jgi:hypothetical protein